MKYAVILAILMCLNGYGKVNQCSIEPVRIAVVDTGFGYQGHGKEAKLCKSGHKDFTGQNFFTEYGFSPIKVPLDTHGHGTNVVGIIESYVKKANVNYCIVILKYSNGYNTWGTLSSSVSAFEYATKLKIPYINYSSGGPQSAKEEERAVRAYLNQGGTFVTAAGNDGQDLDNPKCSYYPAKYDRRLVVVGSLGRNGVKLPSSNYGSCVNRWEIGLDVVGYDIRMSGTSQATATATGKIVSKNKCDIGE